MLQKLRWHAVTHLECKELLDALFSQGGQPPLQLCPQCGAGVSFGRRSDDVPYFCGVSVVHLQDHVAEPGPLAADAGQEKPRLSLGKPHSWPFGPEWLELQGHSRYLCWWWTVCILHASSGSSMWDVEPGGTERQERQTIRNVYCCQNEYYSEQGSRAYLMNTGKNSFHSRLARANDGSNTVVPEKGHLSEARHTCWMPGEALVAAG